MREADLSPIASAWLERRGFTVYAELPLLYYTVDLVGKRELDERVCTIELKPSLTENVARQAYRCRNHAHEIWCGVGTRPARRGAGWDFCCRYGIGVLSLVDDRAIMFKLPAYFVPFIPLDTRNHPVGGTGGLATADYSPKQRVIKAVVDYLEAEEDLQMHRHSWPDVFDAVPNHYAHWQSMRGATSWDLHLARGKRRQVVERAELERLYQQQPEDK